MKRTLLMIFLMMIFASKFTYAGISICYDPDNTVKDFSLRGDPIQSCDYYDAGQNVPQAKYDQVRTLLKTVDRRYLKKLGSDPVEMSPAEKVVVDDALAALLETQFRTQQKDQFNASQGVYLRALIKVLLDEINTLRAQHALAPRTLSQAKTAIQNAIDLKLVDE